MAKQKKSVTTENREAQLARYIFAGSGTMIGICTTIVGIVKIMEGQKGPSRIDEYVAIISIAFLASAIFSYLSIRNEQHARSSRPLGRTADVSFLIGLLGIVLLMLLFAWEHI